MDINCNGSMHFLLQKRKSKLGSRFHQHFGYKFCASIFTLLYTSFLVLYVLRQREMLYRVYHGFRLTKRDDYFCCAGHNTVLEIDLKNLRQMLSKGAGAFGFCTKALVKRGFAFHKCWFTFTRMFSSPLYTFVRSFQNQEIYLLWSM